MSKQIAVSFEGRHVKVSYGFQKNGTLNITRTLTLKEDEFDVFLTREKTKDFIVVFSFQTFYQDVLLLPPADAKYLDTLVEGEIRKNAPELQHFVFFSTILKEKVHEGRPVKETFVFAADSSEIEPLLERFSRYGKRVTHLYADVFAVSQLIVDSANAKEKTILGMMDREGHKILFLMRAGKLTFVRNIQSRGSGIDQYDMTNVNMTVNYARQTLREHPEELIIVSAAGERVATAEGLALPASPFHYPPGVIVAEGETTEFAMPIGGLFLGKESAGESLLPKAYHGMIVKGRILRYASAVFLIVSFLCIGYILSGWNQTHQIRTMIAPLKAEIAGRGRVYEEFELRNRELQEALPYINYLNGESSTPDIQKPLTALQTLNRDKVKVKEIEIKNTGRELILHIKGHIAANTYGELQSRFHKLTDDIKAAKYVQGISEKLDLVGKDFTIEMTWKQ